VVLHACRNAVRAADFITNGNSQRVVDAMGDGASDELRIQCSTTIGSFSYGMENPTAFEGSSRKWVVDRL